MTKALITPSVIEWARKRVDLTPEELAQKVLHRPAPEVVLTWEKGTDQPTFRQAQEIARVTYIPFGFLFLPNPPEDKVAIPDFRKKVNSKSPEMSVNLKDAVKHTLRCQAWYRAYLLDSGAQPLDFIGKYDISCAVNTVADDIKDVLAMDDDFKEYFNKPSDFLTALSRKAEKAGITVCRTGFVGKNNKRELSTDEFRGFALADEYAPFIFINASDYDSAKAFTFFHELAHLWIGESGISDIPLNNPSSKIETFCNDVAAEILVPRLELLSRWNNFVEAIENITALSRFFHVSRMVIARRALELRQITKDQHNQIYAIEAQHYLNRIKKKSDGGNYHYMFRAKNGLYFSQAVLTEAFHGEITQREAASLLNVGIAKLDAYAEAIREVL